MNNPISLRQTLNSGKIPSEKSNAPQNPWPWLSRLKARPIWQEALQASLQIIKTALNVWVMLLLIFPFVLQVAYDIGFSFFTENDVALSFMAMGLMAAWFIFLLTACILLTAFKPFKNVLILFAIGMACFLASGPVVSKFLKPGDYLRLNRDYALYKTETRNAPNIRHSFPWGDYGLAGALSGTRTLVYDPTDRLPEENALENKRLKRKKAGISINTKYLYDHFYIVDNIYF